MRFVSSLLAVFFLATAADARERRVRPPSPRPIVRPAVFVVQAFPFALRAYTTAAPAVACTGGRCPLPR